MTARLALLIHSECESDTVLDAIHSAEAVDEVVVTLGSPNPQLRKALEASKFSVIEYPDSASAASHLADAVRSTNSEWCLILNPDERVEPGGIEVALDLIENSPVDVSAYELSFKTYVGDKQICATGWDSDRYQFHTRLIRKSDVLWTKSDKALCFAGRTVQLDPNSKLAVKQLIFSDISHMFRKFAKAAEQEAIEVTDLSQLSSPVRAFRSGIEEFVRRYSPEEDGVLSWVLSYAHMHERILAQAIAMESESWSNSDPVPSQQAALLAWNAFWSTLVSATIAEERSRIEKKLELDRNVEGAIKSLRGLLSSWGEDAGLLSDLSTLEYSLGFYDAALTHCRRAVELNPADEDAVTNLSLILQATGRPN